MPTIKKRNASDTRNHDYPLSKNTERGYKGNFHIFATIDGKEHKIVIGKNKADYKVLEAAGESGPGEEEIGEIMGRYFAEM
jgi:hypothetical protein